MSTGEDLLYIAHAQGKNVELLKRVGEIRSTKQGQRKDMNELIDMAYQELVKEGTIQLDNS